MPQRDIGSDGGEYELEPPDSSRFVDGSSIQFGEIAAFVLTAALLFLANAFTTVLDGVYGITEATSGFAWDLVSRVMFLPTDGTAELVRLSWDGATAEIGAFEVLAFTVAVAVLIGWLLLLESVLARIRGWFQ